MDDRAKHAEGKFLRVMAALGRELRELDLEFFEERLNSFGARQGRSFDLRAQPVVDYLDKPMLVITMHFDVYPGQVRDEDLIAKRLTVKDQ